MDGSGKISTHVVTTRGPLFPCSKLKMGIASVATPLLSGNHVQESMTVIVLRFYSTCLLKDIFQTNKQARRYSVVAIMDLALEEVVTVS